MIGLLAVKDQFEKRLEKIYGLSDCNKHQIKPKQRFDILGKNNYEVFKTPIPNDDPLDWTDSNLTKKD